MCSITRERNFTSYGLGLVPEHLLFSSGTDYVVVLVFYLPVRKLCDILQERVMEKEDGPAKMKT